MNVDRYLIFDSKEDIIKLASCKFPEDHLIIKGKNEDDIKKFSPKTVLCFQNKKIAEICDNLKINCVYVYTEKVYKIQTKEFISTIFVNPFNFDRIKQSKNNDILNFSMLEETSSDICDLTVNFKKGHKFLVNPGSITTSEILKYFKINKKLEKGSDKRYLEIYNPKNSKIDNFFTEKTSSKVNLYLPTYHRIEKTKKSIDSILEDIKLSKYDVEIYIGDNSPNFPEIRKWLKTLESEKVHIHLGEKNIGKSGMVNYLYKNSRKCDYLFSIDSDMIVTKNLNFVDNMIYHLTRLDNCGLISSNQGDASQHWFGKTVENLKINDMNVGYSEEGVGIAGGCVLLRSKDWEKIGMYKENHDIYTGDDGILTHNIGKILKKYVYISVDCTLIHPRPEESEKDYTEWKAKSWQRDQLKFLDNSYTGENKKGFYD